MHVVCCWLKKDGIRGFVFLSFLLSFFLSFFLCSPKATDVFLQRQRLENKDKPSYCCSCKGNLKTTVAKENNFFHGPVLPDDRHSNAEKVTGVFLIKSYLILIKSDLILIKNFLVKTTVAKENNFFVWQEVTFLLLFLQRQRLENKK